MITFRETSNERIGIIMDIIALASGTIAGLIGSSDYATIDSVHEEWLDWIINDVKRTFPNWQESWEAFVEARHPEFQSRN